MAESIYKMFDYQSPQAIKRNYLDSILPPSTGGDLYSQLAQAGTNTGGLLGYALGGLAGYKPAGMQKAETMDQITAEAAKGANPLAQAKKAYELFAANGMGREAQVAMERMTELKKAEEAQSFNSYMSNPNTSFQSSDDLLQASKKAFAAGNDSAGAQLLNSYRASLKGGTTKAPQNRSYNKKDVTIYEAWDPKQGKYVEYSRAPRSIATSDKKDREYYSGQQVIYETYDSKQGKYVEYARAPRTAKGGPTNDQQNLEFQARTVLNCKLSDPECYKKALENVVAIKRADPGAGKILSGTVERLNETRETAITTRKRIAALDRASGILDGKLGAKPIVGAAAGLRLGIDKFASLFGISNGSAAAVTELLQQNRIADAAALLATGAFGAGTGISDRDLQSAFSIVGADMAVTADGLRMVFAQLRKEGVRDLKQYQQDVEGYDDEVFTAARKKKSFFLIDIPKVVEKAEGPKVPTSKPLNELTDKELRALQNSTKSGEK